jgi:hypothetical protein
MRSGEGSFRSLSLSWISIPRPPRPCRGLERMGKASAARISAREQPDTERGTLTPAWARASAVSHLSLAIRAASGGEMKTVQPAARRVAASAATSGNSSVTVGTRSRASLSPSLLSSALRNSGAVAGGSSQRPSSPSMARMSATATGTRCSRKNDAVARPAGPPTPVTKATRPPADLIRSLISGRPFAPLPPG